MVHQKTLAEAAAEAVAGAIADAVPDQQPHAVAGSQQGPVNQTLLAAAEAVTDAEGLMASQL